MPTKFIKPKDLFAATDTIVLQPLTKTAIERFQLWDNTEKKFYKEGETIDIEGRTNGKPVEVNKYIKLSVEEKNRYRRDMKMVRPVIIDGQEFEYAMPSSLNEKLEATMKTVEAMRQNPLNYSYKITRKKTGSEAWNIEYEVVLADVKTVSPVTTDLDIDVSTDDELSAEETKLLNAIMEKYPNYASLPVDKLAALFVKNIKSTEERAKDIVVAHLR